MQSQEPTSTSKDFSKTLLSVSAGLWFTVVLIGQWLFAVYIVWSFGKKLLAGQIHSVSKMAAGLDLPAIDWMRDLGILAHVSLAAFISAFGMMQLIPAVRRRWPSLHRWNGRLFMVVGLLGAVSGIYLAWVSGLRFGNVLALGITLNGILIVVFALLAWRAALAKKFQQHRRMALHAFMLVQGVWSLRVGLMAWFILNQGPNGNTATLSGPFDITWSYLCYLLPMAMVELYLRAEASTKAREKYVAAATITLTSLVLAIGVFGAAMFMWFPRLH